VIHTDFGMLARQQKRKIPVSTTMSTTQSRHDHPPHSAANTPVAKALPKRHVGLVDRMALHLGVALITWSRRPRDYETRERRANRVEQQLARAAREREAERSYRLSLSQR
jgi:hypothetical protein